MSGKTAAELTRGTHRSKRAAEEDFSPRVQKVARSVRVGTARVGSSRDADVVDVSSREASPVDFRPTAPWAVEHFDVSVGVVPLTAARLREMAEVTAGMGEMASRITREVAGMAEWASKMSRELLNHANRAEAAPKKGGKR